MSKLPGIEKRVRLQMGVAKDVEKLSDSIRHLQSNFGQFFTDAQRCHLDTLKIKCDQTVSSLEREEK